MPLPRLAVLTMHTSPLARPGGSKAGGLNVYVLELSRELAKLGCRVDVLSRRTSTDGAEVIDIEPGLRVIQLAAGPSRQLQPDELYVYTVEFADAVAGFADREGLSYDLVHSH